MGNKERKKKKKKKNKMFSDTKSNTILATMGISALGTMQSAVASPVNTHRGCSIGTEIVKLESLHRKFNSKHFDGYRIDAHIKHVESDTKPTEHNWGFEDHKVWVDAGLRAKFEVTVIDRDCWENLWQVQQVQVHPITTTIVPQQPVVTKTVQVNAPVVTATEKVTETVQVTATVTAPAVTVTVQVQSPPQTQTFVKTANPITITATATKTATVTVVQAQQSNNPQKVVVTATIGGDQQHQLNNNNNNTCEAQFGQRYRKLCKQNGFDRMAKKNTCATSTCTIDECCR